MATGTTSTILLLLLSLRLAAAGVNVRSLLLRVESDLPSVVFHFSVAEAIIILFLSLTPNQSPNWDWILDWLLFILISVVHRRVVIVS